VIDCQRFEKLLWEYSETTGGQEDLAPDIAEHLKKCSKCQQLYIDFKKLFDLAEKGQVEKDDIYWQRFGQAVWKKIETIESLTQPIVSPKDFNGLLIQKSPVSTWKLISSFGLAIGVVLVLLMAVTDVTNQMISPQKPVLTVAKDRISGNNLHTRKFDIILKGASDKGLSLQEFSILPAPEIVEEKDSALVSIDAVYLTDDGLKDKDIRVAKALRIDVVMRTGKMSFEMDEPLKKVIQPEESIITLTKMPYMKKIVTPNYPVLAYQLRKEGDVWIKALVGPEGEVLKAMIYKESGTNYGFENAALNAAYKNEFEPFEVDGKKLPVWVLYKVRFVVKK
jgi:TonB family protein